MNKTGKGSFTKGDSRINRKGRPKSFDALRALAQQISHEAIVAKDGDTYTVTEAILRKWATSGNPQLQMKFIEIAFGKVPDQVEVNGKKGGAIEIHVVYDNKADGSST